MSNKKLQMEDSLGNILHPETETDVVIYGAGTATQALDKLNDEDKVLIGTTEPTGHGVWFDTTNNPSAASQESAVITELKEYVDNEIQPQIDDNVADIAAVQSNLDTATKTAQYQSQIVSNEELNAFTIDTQKQASVDIEGNTVINTLAPDGDCEAVGKWLGWQLTAAVDGTTKAIGANSLKLTMSGTAGSLYKLKANLGIDPSKYYLYSAYLKNGNATSINLQFYTQTVSVTDTTKFNRVGILVTPAMAAAMTEIDITLSGASGQYGWVDGIMLNEITPEEYALGVTELLKKYSYVSGDASVGDIPTKIKTCGKNLLNLVQGSIDGYGYPIVQSIRLSHKDGLIVAKPNTTYTVSLNKPLGFVWHHFTKEKNIIDANIWQTAGTSFSFTTGADAKYIGVAFKIDDTMPIYAQDYQIQIEEGSVATTYEPYKESFIEINAPLRALNSTVKDEIKDGKLIKRVGYLVLDGSLPWLFGNHYTGYKYARIPIEYLQNFFIDPTEIAETEAHKVLNHKNKLLTNKVSFATYGSQYECFNVNSGGLALTINATDSGWGDSYTPTQAEIQAYFYGWKMYDSTANPGGGGVWNGTGTKSWCYTNASGIYAGGTGTLPTSYAPTWNPYRVYFQLTIPVVEDVNNFHINLFENGKTTVESVYPLWVRPKVTYKIADNTKANINEIEKVLSLQKLKSIQNAKDVKNISNPNLLINPAFQVYQRGSSFTASTSTTYTMDRWVLAGDTAATIAKSQKGVKINVVNVGNWTNFHQMLEDSISSVLVGKTVTFSCKVSNPNNISQMWAAGALSNGQNIYFTGGGPQFIDYNTGILYSTFKVDKFTTRFHVGIQFKSNVAGLETEVEWAKLEVGDKPTLFSAPSIPEELMKCQRYYMPVTRGGYYNTFGSGMVASATLATVVVPLPVTLRTTPTVLISNKSTSEHLSITVGGTKHVVTSLYTDGNLLSNNAIAFNVSTSDTLTVGQAAILCGGSSQMSFALDAEIY